MGLNSRRQPFPVLKTLDSDAKGRMVGLLGLAALSVWIIVSISTNLYFSVVSRHWPTAAARITSSGVYAHGKGVGVSWNPVVDYEYQVGGATLHSSKIRFLMRAFYDAEEANDVQSSYPAGRMVTASYDPQDPGRSVLEPGLQPGMWTQGLIPLFFCGLCGYILFEITHPERRLLLRSNPIDADYEDEGKGGDEAEMA